MNTAVQAKVVFQHILLGLAACASAHAQLPASLLSGGYTGRSVSGTTVSIASLRVPEKAWRHFEKAKTLAAHNRSFESKVESRKAIAIAPRFTVAYLLCASAEVQEHDFQAALISISEAERVEPNAMWSHVLLASTYNGLRRYDDAEAVLNQVRGPEAESWQAAYEHARAAIGLRDATSAQRWSKAAMASAPRTFADIYLLRANAFILAQRWAEAACQMESYLHASVASPRHTEVLAALEHARIELGKEGVEQILK